MLQVWGRSWYSCGSILDAWSAMSLRDVFCQDRAIGLLQRGLAMDRPAHAYIFAGPEEEATSLFFDLMCSFCLMALTAFSIFSLFVS